MCFTAEVGPQEALLDLLWKDDERPAGLVLIGHVETKTIPGEVMGRRIVLPGKHAWLRAEDILDRVQKKSWDQQPHTLVLLMGCETGLAELGTLSGFVSALNSARAAAVVGTECIGFSRLLTRFATEVTLALWNEKKLGDAVTDFRKQMLVDGNPLAFVFQAVGSADVQLALRDRP